MAQTIDPRRVAADATTISLDEPWQVAHWCQEFGVDAAALREATQAVGDRVQDVRRQLHRPAAAPKWPAGIAMDDEQLTVAGVLIAARPSPFAS
jgi:hypothetical protein